MKIRVPLLAAAALAAGLGIPAAGCRSPGTLPPAMARAVAVLEARAGSRLEGTASFESMGERWISLRIEVRNVAPGLHAVHIHEHGDCSDPKAAGAGGHWNPANRKHGQWGRPDGEFHLGDIGNIEVGPDGTGVLTMTTDLWAIGGGGATDILGRSIIVHARPDDFTTQPTGDAGDRIGCGPIARVEE